MSEKSLSAVSRKGFSEPTEIQRKTIPLLLEGNVDIVGQAQTGTGKTAAFGIPIIEKIAAGTGRVQALVLVPTRELALQVCDELASLKGKKKLRIYPVYGGQSMADQLRALKEGVDVVVGTPGRVLDHVKRKSLRLEDIAYAVLDEADEMLNMGFIDDVEEILRRTGKEKRTLLFSATMPEHIMAIARRHMREYTVVAARKSTLTVDRIDQVYYRVARPDRLDLLCRIIDCEEDFYGLVFCRTRADVDELTRRLQERGYRAEGIHGEFNQPQRERTLEKFRKKLITVLVATDVAARGIDVSCLTHVVNYALPQEPETYVHRIGRTGRAGRTGTAVSFVEPSEERKLWLIMKLSKAAIRGVPAPSAGDVVKAKRERLAREIEGIIEGGAHGPCLNAAMDLCEHRDPVAVLAALLKRTFGSDLDPRGYREIREPKPAGKGAARGDHGKKGGNGANRKKYPHAVNGHAAGKTGASSKGRRRP